MKTQINSRWALVVSLVMAGLFGTLLAASPASADTITIDLDVGNCPLNRVRFPFATVTVTLNVAGTTAHVTFDSSSAAHCSNASGCKMGGLKAADLNVNGLFTVGSITEAPPGVLNSVATIPSDVACFGLFNLRVSNQDGYLKSTTKIEFDVTRVGGTWSTASDVLQPNNFGHVAAAHIYAAGGVCPGLCIGYATNNP